MAKRIFVNGPCLISFGTQGSGGGGALTELGLTEGGVNIDFDLYDDPVMADSGGRVEVDVQDMGKAANISGRLVVYDTDALELLMARGAGANAAALAGPLEPSPGKLLLANTRMRRVILTSPDGNLPYRFLYCWLTTPASIKLGSERSKPDFRFRAIPGTGVNSSMKDRPLYDRIAA